MSCVRPRRRANAGETPVAQGRFDEAAEALRESARTLRTAGVIEEAAFADTQLARTVAARGDLVEAERMLRAALDELQALGSPMIALTTAVHLADVRLRRDDPAGALDTLDAAEAAAGDGGGDPRALHGARPGWPSSRSDMSTRPRPLCRTRSASRRNRAWCSSTRCSSSPTPTSRAEGVTRRTAGRVGSARPRRPAPAGCPDAARRPRRLSDRYPNSFGSVKSGSPTP